MGATGLCLDRPRPHVWTRTRASSQLPKELLFGASSLRLHPFSTVTPSLCGSSLFPTASTGPEPPGSDTRRPRTARALRPRGGGSVCLMKLGSRGVFNIPRHAGLFLLESACQLSPGMFILTATCGQGWCQLYGIGYADLTLGTRPPGPRARQAARAAPS